VQFDSLVVVVSLMSIYRITRMMHARALFYWKINEFFVFLGRGELNISNFIFNGSL
jgi:hypothetical protein